MNFLYRRVLIECLSSHSFYLFLTRWGILAAQWKIYFWILQFHLDICYTFNESNNGLLWNAIVFSLLFWSSHYMKETLCSKCNKMRLIIIIIPPTLVSIKCTFQYYYLLIVRVESLIIVLVLFFSYPFIIFISSLCKYG